jgi:hypothetical protein
VDLVSVPDWQPTKITVDMINSNASAKTLVIILSLVRFVGFRHRWRGQGHATAWRPPLCGIKAAATRLQVGSTFTRGPISTSFADGPLPQLDSFGCGAVQPARRSTARWHGHWMRHTGCRMADLRRCGPWLPVEKPTERASRRRLGIRIRSSCRQVWNWTGEIERSNLEWRDTLDGGVRGARASGIIRSVFAEF